MDEDLLADSERAITRRTEWVAEGASVDEVLIAFAEALGEDAAMIRRLAAEVTRLSEEAAGLRSELEKGRSPFRY